MAAGADKRIELSPAGGLGLVDVEARLLIRFDEIETTTRPQDETGVCEDFDVGITPVATAMPSKIDAVLGRGRLFNGGTTGLATRDKDPGSTLFTRDMSIQVVIGWDAEGQDAAGIPGTIVSRGLGGSSAERVCYGLRLDVIDAPTFTGLIRWYWQDVAGVEKLQDGAQVVIEPAQYTMLTATRRWVSPTQVELAYYVGDRLLGTVTSADGSIGGGTTGALQLGCRTSGGVNGAFLAGTLDELLIVDRELCAEEVEGTWLRITLYQPRAVQLLRDLIDPEFPISDKPDSDAQLDIRMQGHLLGFAAAQTEMLRAYFLPQHAYGSTLAQWEEAVAVTPKPGPAGSIQERRGRVLSRLRQKQGISIPGLEEALRDLVDCDVSDLEFIAYSALVEDGFDAAVDPVLWDMTPTGCAAFSAGKARFAPGAGDYRLSDGLKNWRTIARPVSQPSVPGVFGGEHVVAKLVVSTPQNNFEAGVWLGDKSLHNYILIGLRETGGVFQIVTERVVEAVSQGVTVLATPGANPAATWFHLYEHAAGLWTAAWSFTSGTGPFAFSDPLAQPTLVHWAGCYVRSIAAVAAGPVADFDEFQLWEPNGTRAFNAYVFRDPGLGGSPDLEGAHSVIRAIKHAFTHATIITSRALLSGDPGSLCDRGPMGAL